jgi:hypothetical protein
MSTASVHEKHNRIGSIKGVLVLGPAIQIDRRGDTRVVLKALVEELHTRVELMFTAAMTGNSGEQDDVFLGFRGRSRRGEAQASGAQQEREYPLKEEFHPKPNARVRIDKGKSATPLI